MVKIGSVEINSNIFLAPMAGVTDLAFRSIAREHGAKFCFFEMVDANALVYNSGKNLAILETTEQDQPIAAQIVGAGAKKMLAAAKKLLTIVKPSFLDINAGCPVRKVVKKKAGAFFLSQPEGLYEIIRTLSQELPLPITVKLRSGYENIDLLKLAEIARACQESGAAALFVHGRSQKQAYSGQVDYQAIKVVKDNVSIPVFGSGNVFSPELAKKMLDETGCDGVLVARGAYGNPWIFENIASYLKTGQEKIVVTAKMKKETAKQHLAYVQKYKIARPKGKVGFMRKILIWYSKALPHSTNLRNNITKACSYEELLALVDQF